MHPSLRLFLDWVGDELCSWGVIRSAAGSIVHVRKPTLSRQFVRALTPAPGSQSPEPNDCQVNNTAHAGS